MAFQSPVIKAADLKKVYGTVLAVDSIQFSVRKGEIFGFLGPNGAGKTTTMKMITCVSPRSSGTLEVLGMDPEKNPAEIKQHIGVVPQETNLDLDFTCFGNLYYYSRYFDIPKEAAEKKADELLEFVQLKEKRDVSVEKLSGGMKRRLILARALVNNPDLLILDEPTIGLDPQARHLIWEKLRSIKAQGNTIVMTTHYLDEAARLCDRLVIMDNGKILVEGTPEDLVREHVGQEIVEMESSDEVLTCLRELQAPFEKTGDMVQIAADTDTARNIARTILEKCRPGRMITRPATLEDVFLKLAGRNLRE
ncbi:MAG TPA: ABC transporter ATP-binding protein [Methanoregula sp.]|nr:ABC transporter ATP-binding protein [Methanoregula sp.]